MKLEVKNAITPKSFTGFAVFIIIQFIVYINSEQTTFDLFLMILNISVAVVLTILGVDKPSVSKFFTEMGSVMLDFAASPQMKLQKIQSLWQQFALLWMTTVDECKQEEAKKESTPPYDTAAKDLKV